jgi:hypothetical protein
LSEAFLPELNRLIALGVKFAGVALDNENTENAFFDKLQDQLEFLLHIPCSAHVIQLVVKNILKHSTVKEAIDKMVEVLGEISSNKELRLKILNMQQSEGISVGLVKPNATRWNSTLNAIQRFIKFKKVINYHKGTYTNTHTHTRTHNTHTHLYTHTCSVSLFLFLALSLFLYVQLVM